MKTKLIVIALDYTDIKNTKSYFETLDAIQKEEPIIHTNCLEFFSFYYLEKGYDVKVVKQNGDYIVLSELLTDQENLYTRRNIRKAHDVRKLLITHEFRFKKAN